MPEPTAMLENVSVQYGDGDKKVCAVKDVSLSFAPGTLTLIMGPSGSGKTTLLTLLGCLQDPDRGDVWIQSQNIRSLNSAERTVLRRDRIGFVFQAFRLFHSLNALENVLISAEVAGVTDRIHDRARALGLLKELGLERKAKLKPDQLSGGEKQRVAIARAMLRNPELLLADEPTASLDSASGRQIAEILYRLAERHQRTVVVVSHDPRWIESAHRVVELRDGKVTKDEEMKTWVA